MKRESRLSCLNGFASLTKTNSVYFRCVAGARTGSDLRLHATYLYCWTIKAVCFCFLNPVKSVLFSSEF